ncbi:hypothetical protein Tco_0763455 [Tanacetum coccineum]
MISVNNLKTDSENDNEEVGIPSFPPPKPTTSYIDDLDFFNGFENEFPAIVYNDAQTSKSDLLTEPILSPQHIDEFNLNNETSVSEYDEDKQNTLYFNDIFPFNIIRPDDLKSEKDNNDNDIDIIQSLEGNEITHRSNMLMDSSSDKIDKIFDKESFVLELNVNIGLEYTNADIADFKERLERIYSQDIHKVKVEDFLGMPKLMRDGLFARMVMEHRDDASVVVFTIRAWGRLFDTKGPLVRELVLEFFSTLRFGEFILALGLHIREEMESPNFTRFPKTSPFLHFDQRSGIRLFHRIMAHSIAGRSQAPEKVTVMDLFYLRGMEVGSVNVPYLLARYLRLFAARRKSRAHISGGQFVARLAGHFGLLTEEILGGLTVIALIWPDAVAGAFAVAKDVPAANEGDQAVPVPVHAPQ